MTHISPRNLDTHKKDVIAIRNWLHGRNFGMASFALEYASRYHTNKRKDQLTPEFNHMIIIASYLRTLSDGFSFREETLALAFLHDLPEDYDISFEKIESDFKKEWEIQEKVYSRENLESFNVSRMMTALRLLTKKYNKTVTPPDVYFPAMENDPIASIVKGVDRIHNFATCGSVFSDVKKQSYIKETELFILPMIKQAQRNYPQQNNVYENIKLVLKMQMDLIECGIKKSKKKSTKKKANT